MQTRYVGAALCAVLGLCATGASAAETLIYSQSGMTATELEVVPPTMFPNEPSVTIPQLGEALPDDVYDIVLTTTATILMNDSTVYGQYDANFYYPPFGVSPPLVGGSDGLLVDPITFTPTSDGYIAHVSEAATLTGVLPQQGLGYYDWRASSPGEALIDLYFSEPYVPYTLDVYQVSPTPEPATWALALVGLFGVGAMLRRKPRYGALGQA